MSTGEGERVGKPIFGQDAPLSLQEAAFQKLKDLKDLGNAEFVKQSEEGFRRACIIYGQVLSGMMQYEHEFDSAEQQQAQLPTQLKATIFLNLAAANLQLGGLEACFKCCNAAILFINDPALLLENLDLGVDFVDEVVLAEPVPVELQSLAEKALYRRGKCLKEMGGIHLEGASKDLYKFLRLIREDSGLHKSVQSMLLAIETGTTTIGTTTISMSDSNSDMHDYMSTTSAASTIFSGARRHAQRAAGGRGGRAGRGGGGGGSRGSSSLKDVKQKGDNSKTTSLEEMTVNGGWCLRRRANWAQSVRDATVYLSVAELLARRKRVQSASTSSSSSSLPAVNDFKSSDWKVQFSIDSIAVKFRGEYLLPPQSLEYNIIVSSSIWTLEDFATRSTTGESGGEPTHLVLYLCKAPSVEWFPGCEWWDRVFVDDEPIDTSTCSISPGNASELPEESRLRAEREHSRFANSTKEEQSAELSFLSTCKKELYDAAWSLHETEEEAFREEPEREELVEALRAQLPGIFVTARPAKEER